MFKLRQTWNAIIPARKLIAIDKHIHSIDSGWPVMPESPTTPQSPTIFVNPKFVKVASSGNFLIALIYVLCCLQPDNNELATKKVEVESEQAKDSDEVKQGATTNIQEQRKTLLEQQRQIRLERERQMGLHTSEATANDTPLKPAISGSKGSRVLSGAPKRVRFYDEEQVTL